MKGKKIYITLGILFVIWHSYLIIVDMYNFNQLKKAKPILENIPKDAKRFYNIKQFNEIYNINIKPIKNCYDINNYNGRNKYMFGFKLESPIYRYIYGDNYYSYPGYDTPYAQWCEISRGCFDKNREIFEDIVSNPCNDKEE